MSYEAQENSLQDGAPIELYRFASGDRTWHYTSYAEPVVYLGKTYEPIPLKRTEPEQSSELAATRITLSMPRDVALVIPFIIYPPSATIWLDIFRQHATDESLETYTFWKGRLRGVKWEGATAKAECEPHHAALKRQGLYRQFQSPCNHTLYSLPCGVNKEGWRREATILNVSGNQITAAAFGAEADGFFAGGYVERANHERRQIKAHAGDTITIDAPFLDLAPGELVDAYTGCDRSYATCKAKFNNGLRFGGFPFIPIKNIFKTGVRQ